jgi:hypothetical protein
MTIGGSGDDDGAVKLARDLIEVHGNDAPTNRPGQCSHRGARRSADACEVVDSGAQYDPAAAGGRSKDI